MLLVVFFSHRKTNTLSLSTFQCYMFYSFTQFAGDFSVTWQPEKGHGKHLDAGLGVLTSNAHSQCFWREITKYLPLRYRTSPPYTIDDTFRWQASRNALSPKEDGSRSHKDEKLQEHTPCSKNLARLRRLFIKFKGKCQETCFAKS